MSLLPEAAGSIPKGVSVRWLSWLECGFSTTKVARLTPQLRRFDYSKEEENVTMQTETALMRPEAKEHWEPLRHGKRQARDSSLESPEEPDLLTFLS